MEDLTKDDKELIMKMMPMFGIEMKKKIAAASLAPSLRVGEEDEEGEDATDSVTASKSLGSHGSKGAKGGKGHPRWAKFKHIPAI